MVDGIDKSDIKNALSDITEFVYGHPEKSREETFEEEPASNFANTVYREMNNPEYDLETTLTPEQIQQHNKEIINQFTDKLAQSRQNPSPLSKS